MGETNTRHRPLVSGIRVVSGIKVATFDEDGELQEEIQYAGGGTLAGLATRNSDGKRVLVTKGHYIQFFLIEV